MGTVDVKMVITLVLMLLASSTTLTFSTEAVGRDQKAELLLPQPPEVNEAESKREAKQLWPILASYYVQQGQRPIQFNWRYKQPKTASSSLDSSILVQPPPTPLLSASSLFSKYTKTLPKNKNYSKSKTIGNQHVEEEQNSEWNYRVSETSAILSSDPLGTEAGATSKAAAVAASGLNASNTAEVDMAASSANVNNLIGTLPPHASLDRIESRQNLYGPELDIRPIDLPGAVITPGDRRLNGTDIDEISLIPISGVGRPPIPQKPEECCLFVFLDGSAYYFDEFMRKVTGFYRVMYGSVNGHPHYVARNCRKPDEYGTSCTYIWYSGYGWVVGVGRYIGQTKGVMFTRSEGQCPTDLDNWRYLDQDLNWQDNGNIYVKCAS